MEQGNKKIRQLTSEYMERQALLEEQRRRRRKGLIRRLSVFTFCAVIFLSFVGVTIFQQQASIQAQNTQIEQMEEEFVHLEKEEVRLKQEIEWLHDPEYIAELARRDFFLTKPGETLFQLPRSGTPSD
ncbi:FtsB family cell division protein [Salipaludibacillus sp. HK11]|uniref:FtsB family cell division protein n=1 Tax=Salipaludibacillus sp. HK11 TaxID=3394320 RepID=UPI0039FBB34B